MRQHISLLLALSLLLGQMAPLAAAAAPEMPTLVSEDHRAYLSGTGDGNFAPMKILTRAEAAMLIYNCLSFKPSLTASLPDVPAGVWYHDAACTLASLGIIASGKPFQGEQPIAKGELIYYIMFFFPERTDAQLFPDVSESSKYAPAIRSARAYGFVSGDNEGKLHPGGTITRAETAALFNLVLGRNPDTASIRKNRPVFFLDVPANAWYYYHVVEASVSHTYSKSGAAETWTSFTAPASVLPADFTTPGFHLYNGYSYYYDASQGDILRNTTLYGTWTFDAQGKQTTGDAELDAGLAQILRTVCTDTMTQADKLKAVFAYCRDSFKYGKSDVASASNPYSKAFVLNAAKKMLSKNRGNCYNFASVFYYLARWLGYDPVVYSGTLLGDAHSWVEISEGEVSYIYDTQMAWRWYHDRNREDYMWYFWKFIDSGDRWKYRGRNEPV